MVINSARVRTDAERSSIAKSPRSPPPSAPRSESIYCTISTSVWQTFLHTLVDHTHGRAHRALRKQKMVFFEIICVLMVVAFTVGVLFYYLRDYERTGALKSPAGVSRECTDRRRDNLMRISTYV
jgi:hypothetical protein